MPDERTNNPSPGTEPDAPRPSRAPPPHRPAAARRLITAGVVIAVLVVGAAGGAGAYRYIENRRPHSVLLLQPAPIAQMATASPVAVKGQVAEIFGNKFIIRDDSGRALVETGPRGEGGNLVKPGETVTVQGRFDDGFIHAEIMTRADGTSEAFGPPHPHRGDRPGPRADRGPGRDPPPPPHEH
ncbi:MAG TPA: hypothetical protein VFC56_16665 [Stellaceae bacterium]|nr:hypothetical protein [Stellaceae bacterium]